MEKYASDQHLIRDYENPKLPLEKRVPSLARRFSCLSRADGLTPWAAETFYAWVTAQAKSSSEWHAGHFILNLWGEGPWGPFDAIAAVSKWSDPDRTLFAAWARSWR
ncbi:MAG: hypothetical protein QNJ97_23270 [Myxococcota bacterium]|nr:hypothetical protein [Myxococcota bacterium]